VRCQLNPGGVFQDFRSSPLVYRGLSLSVAGQKNGVGAKNLYLSLEVHPDPKRIVIGR